jgi:hypothetical protein
MSHHRRASFAWVALISLTTAACGGATIPQTGEPQGDAGTGNDGGGPSPGIDGGSPHPGIEASCGVVEIIPPVLTVNDFFTGNPICDAVLADNDAGAGLYPCTVGEEGCTAKCQYTVNGDEGGSSFSITVTAPGYSISEVTGLMTNYCGCNTSQCPAPQQLTTTLAPIPDAGPPEPDGGSSGCPATEPAQGDDCPTDNLTCEYGTNANPYCNDLWECDGGAWQDMAPPSNGCVPPGATCPDYASISGTSTTCTLQSQTCDYSQGTCVCTDSPGGLPTTNGPFWSCVPISQGCPGPRPPLGSPCSVDSTTVCDYGECSGGVAMTCTDGYWSIAMDIACAG